MLNGVTQLVVTKADVLSGFDTIKVCTHYILNKKKVDYLPYEVNELLQPVYKEFKGWKEDITKIKSFTDLPAAFKSYLQFIEDEIKVPIKIISVGPNRSETIQK
jgi:adenylosuccinate synthase